MRQSVETVEDKPTIVDASSSYEARRGIQFQIYDTIVDPPKFLPNFCSHDIQDQEWLLPIDMDGSVGSQLIHTSSSLNNIGIYADEGLEHEAFVGGAYLLKGDKFFEDGEN